jgi:hypothetical protein
MALTDLKHPIRPSTVRFMELLETRLNHDQIVEHWFNPRTTYAASHLFFTLVSLAQRCLAEGHRVNAERVLDLGYERVPRLFSGKAEVDRFKSEVKNTLVPPRMPRNPTEAEIAAGKEVDAEGNVVVTPEAQAYWERTYLR